MRTIDADVDPARVAARIAARKDYVERMEREHGFPKRCATGIVNQDGSCVYCGDDQGERVRCPS